MFSDAGTADIFDGKNSQAAARVCPPALHSVARRKLIAIAVAAALDDLRAPPGNRLQALVGDRAGRHSIRVNDQYRVTFRWTDNGAADVAIVDYH